MGFTSGLRENPATKSLRFVVLTLVLLSLPGLATSARLYIDHARIWGNGEGVLDTLPIVADSLSSDIGGFHLVLAEAEDHYTITKVIPGRLVTECNWEYFSWRRIDLAESSYHPGYQEGYKVPYTALIEITGLASVNGTHLPTCYTYGSVVELASLEILVAPTRPWQEYAYAPVSFYWRDCRDNALLTHQGDTAFTANSVTEQWSGATDAYPFPGFGAPGVSCTSVGGQVAVPQLAVTNGLIEYGWWYGYGDLNLNSIAYEAADVQLFSRYFVYGLGVFTINMNGQIAASDVDHDGQPLQLADLYRLMMINRLDHFGMYPPHIDSAAISGHPDVDRVAYELNTSVPTGACYIRLVSPKGVAPRVNTPLGSTVIVGSIGDTTTLLWINASGGSVIPSGRSILFEADSDVRVVEASLVNTTGQAMKTMVTEELPHQFALAQNYPNPFNPATAISFDLRHAGWVQLDVVNILGEHVKTLLAAEMSAGSHSVIWDGTDASGQAVGSAIYFYRLQTDGFSATKKMMLLK